MESEMDSVIALFLTCFLHRGPIKESPWTDPKGAYDNPSSYCHLTYTIYADNGEDKRMIHSTKERQEEGKHYKD